MSEQETAPPATTSNVVTTAQNVQVLPPSIAAALAAPPAPAAQTPAQPSTIPAQVEVHNPLQDVFGQYTTDPGINVAVNLLGKLGSVQGFDFERAIGQALEQGDHRFINDEYLSTALGDNAKDFKELFTQVYTYAAQQRKATIDAVHASVGGKEHWDNVVKVFEGSAPKGVQELISSALDSPDPDTRNFAVQQIVNYGKTVGAVPNKSTPLSNTGVRSGMTSAEYKKALQSVGRITPERYEDLRNARRLGIQQGLK